MSNTPRTDACWQMFQKYPGCEHGDPWLLARELERELAEARQWSSTLADTADGMRADLQEVMKVLSNLMPFVLEDYCHEFATRELAAAVEAAMRLCGIDNSAAK